MTTAIAPSRTAAVAFDLEGALINVSTICRLANDASAFHAAMLGCPPNPRVVEAACKARESGQAVLVMTSAPRRLEQFVTVWLGRSKVPATLLFMRGRGDHRPSAVLQRERLLAMHHQYADMTVWSADPNVIRLSEQEGIDVRKLRGYWGQTW